MAKRFFLLLFVSLSTIMMSFESFSFDENLNRRISAAGMFFLPEFSTAPAEPEVEAPSEPAVLPQLRSLENTDLASRLRERINANPVWRELVRSKKMAIGVVDMANTAAVSYASINGRHMMYAASLPKIAVLAAAHDAIERGELKETATVRQDMRLMIAKSNNAATTRMIDLVGFKNIERTMTSPALKLYDPEFGGGLWVGKRYAAGGNRHPDPMLGISHAATTEQICRFFYLLANDQLLSPESSAKMRSYLVDPELHHKFVNTLDQVAPDAKVYRKSGSWSTFHADVALVQGPARNYVMTALIDDANGEQICRDLAKVLDDLLKHPVAK
ncbi:serine hydrolase [Neolewinella lacunae]|nr:serine hydrolase [Neolewinella lacunae]MDN3633143.1 serine hydrolase [Neolewinella lacunae]